MDQEQLLEWLDRHHVDVVRTQVTTLDGPSIGKYLNRGKFLKSLPAGHNISDMALAMDITGTPHLTFWHDFRSPTFGDIQVVPDLNTLQTDGRDPNLGHCIGDFSKKDGTPISICPRTFLKKMTGLLETRGLSAKTAFELEFMMFKESFEEAREKKYQNLTPLGASRDSNIYLLKNAYHFKPFMDKVIENLNWRGIAWEAWNDENESGQIELNLEPADPITAADNVIRVKQILYETAVDMGLSLTFMPKMNRRLPTGMHIHHSLSKNGEPAFYSNTSADSRSELLYQWLGGLMACLPASVSFLCPNINSYRRMVDFAAPPTRAVWGEENKSAAFRLIGHSPQMARIEHRLPSSDVNPYLASGIILASGLYGLDNQLSPPPEFHRIAWSATSEQAEKLPNTISMSADRLEQDHRLEEIVGKDFIRYWIESRRLEWVNFQTESGDPYGADVTDWELNRYFELV